MPIEVDFQDGRKGTYSSFKEITSLKNYNYIVSIDCSNNQLTELPTLPYTLEEFYCSGNILTELPKLPDFLKYLDCSNNKLTELQELPDSLENLNCNYNKLQSNGFVKENTFNSSFEKQYQNKDLVILKRKKLIYEGGI